MKFLKGELGDCPKCSYPKADLVTLGQCNNRGKNIEGLKIISFKCDNCGESEKANIPQVMSDLSNRKTIW